MPWDSHRDKPLVPPPVTASIHPAPPNPFPSPTHPGHCLWLRPWHLTLPPISEESSLSSSWWLVSLPFKCSNPRLLFSRSSRLPQWVWKINSVCLCANMCMYACKDELGSWEKNTVGSFVQLEMEGMQCSHQLFSFSFFNWSIIALQCSVSFCCTMKWISCMYTCVSSLLDLPPHPSTPSLLSRSSQSTKLSFLYFIAGSH